MEYTIVSMLWLCRWLAHRFRRRKLKGPDLAGMEKTITCFYSGLAVIWNFGSNSRITLARGIHIGLSHIDYRLLSYFLPFHTLSKRENGHKYIITGDNSPIVRAEEKFRAITDRGEFPPYEPSRGGNRAISVPKGGVAISLGGESPLDHRLSHRETFFRQAEIPDAARLSGALSGRSAIFDLEECPSAALAFSAPLDGSRRAHGAAPRPRKSRNRGGNK